MKQKEKVTEADYSAVVNICCDAVRDEYRMARMNMPQYTLHIVTTVLYALEKNGMLCDLRKETP